MKRRPLRMSRRAVCSRLDLPLGCFCCSCSRLGSENIRGQEYRSSRCCRVILQEAIERQGLPGGDVTKLSDRAAEGCKRTSLRVHGGNVITGEERIQVVDCEIGRGKVIGSAVDLGR